ncbi:hypothetical protein IPO96_00055 [Candidatus Saccharibacteria bacterium]|nr:MAG: hypothetical protein IPO96_00055 [Candidatus Saccharibacteria bacterium]
MKNKFNSAYLSSLTNGPGDFLPSSVDILANGIKRAEINGLEGETIEYVRFAPDSSAKAQQKPSIYIPGFTEGITAKAPFGMAMLELGNDIIIPDQNRSAKPDKKEAAKTQAINYLAVLDAEGLTHEPINAVAHSYGSYILAEMVKIAKERGWTCFDEAKVALLAPGGSYPDEAMFSKLGVRFAKEMLFELSKKTKKALPDVSKQMDKAGKKNLTKNIGRTWAEARQLATQMIRFEGDGEPRSLGRYVGEIGLFGYTDDKLFSHKQLERAAQQLMDNNGSYASPVQFLEVVDQDGNTRVVKNNNPQTHNDEQWNPRRVAGAINEFFSS